VRHVFDVQHEDAVNDSVANDQIQIAEGRRVGDRGGGHGQQQEHDAEESSDHEAGRFYPVCGYSACAGAGAAVVIFGSSRACFASMPYGSSV
jgi:hypothetical protein